MNETIKKDILEVLKGLIDILNVKEETDISQIKELSDHTIHNASIFQDEDSVSIAVLIYALSKLIERSMQDMDYARFISILTDAKNYLEKDNFIFYRRTVNKSIKLISKIDSKIKYYIGEVVNQAQIKKGSKLFQHGISIARAAEILGITQWELMNYIGKTRIIDWYEFENISVNDRIKYAKKLFSR